MSYGQADPASADERGVVPYDIQARIRKLRVEEQWERYDSFVVGEDAGNQSDTWFNTWVDMANAEEIQLFSGRAPNVGKSYTNQTTERTDWAQDIHSIGIEMIAPPGIADLESDANDAVNLPLIFSNIFPQMLHVEVVLAESDSIASAPANHFPAGYGVSYPAMSAAAAPVVIGGNNGEPVVSNTWKFPEPIMLAAKAKITMRFRIDAPIRQLFANISGPGHKVVPTGNAAPNDTHNFPNRYVVKATLRGPRFLQVRGARSSA